jgi:hypothetical protein
MYSMPLLVGLQDSELYLQGNETRHEARGNRVGRLAEHECCKQISGA